MLFKDITRFLACRRQEFYTAIDTLYTLVKKEWAYTDGALAEAEDDP